MKQNKKTINEAQLRAIVSEAVKSVLKEETISQDITGNERFREPINKTLSQLHSIYETWQYAKYKPKGMDKVIDTIIDAMLKLKELLPPTGDLGPYEGEPYNFGY